MTVWKNIQVAGFAILSKDHSRKMPQLNYKMILVLIALILTPRGTAIKNKTQLYIGGLFPLTGASVDSSGRALLPACEMAMRMVNNRTDILPDYELNMVRGDTKCDVGNGIKILYEYLDRSTPVIMLLGAACSSVTKVVAESAWHWNLLQVSYASTASGLSDKAKYPLLYRAVSPDSAYNTARVKFMEFYRWSKVATLKQDDFVFTEVMSELHHSFTAHNITLVVSESFSGDPRSHLATMKEKDARIIVGMFYEDKARQVFCEAYKLGMYGAKYTWLLLDWADDHKWWLTKDNLVSCTAEQMTRAVNGYFSVDSVSLMGSDQPGVSGMTSQEFMRTFRRSYGNKTLYVPFAFDSVWMVALALHKAALRMRPMNKSLEQFTYKDERMKDVLQASMESLSFQGVTGHIEFTSKGERKRPVRINQLQGGRPVTIAIYQPATGRITQNATVPVIWQGAGPPSDGQRTTYKVAYISVPLFWVVIVLASCGILLALGFLCFNFRYRNHSYIRLSSPNLNNVIVLGAILIYLSIYLVAMDGHNVDRTTIPQICAATSYVLGIGYSLAVGAMFSKTWRVHQIFNKVKPKKKVFRDSELIGLVVLLVLVDLLVLSLWAGVDPLKYVLHDTDERSRDGNVLIIHQYEYCRSKYTTTWLYIIMGYKGLILLVGCFISWETRKVKVRALNDSRFVGMSVYNIVLAVVIGGPLTFLIGDDRNAFVAIYSFFVFFPTSISLCLLFVPKIIKVRKHPEEFLRLQSLSAMRMSSEYGSNYSSSSTDHVTIVRLQAELAQTKRELEKQKRTSYLAVDDRSDFDHTDSVQQDLSQIRSSRSQTCLDLSELEHTSPVQPPQRRCNTYSGSIHTLALNGSYLGEGRDTESGLKAENEQLHRKLQESKINEAGKMCKILYKNAELNRKLVELNMKQRANSTEDDDTVTRLMRENTELKRQLGEVSILNSVWCDVTPKLRRKAREDSKGRDDLKELNKLLTVDLGGGSRSSFGPSRLSRPAPIGKSQSTLDLLDAKGDEETGNEQEDFRADNCDQGIMIVVDDDKTRLVDDKEEPTVETNSTREAEINTSKAETTKRKTSHNTAVMDKTNSITYSERDVVSRRDNGGFVYDERDGTNNDLQNLPLSLKSSGMFNNNFGNQTDTKQDKIFSNENEARNLPLPVGRGRQVVSEASVSGMESAPVSPQPLTASYDHAHGEASHQTADPSSISRRRQKSKRDKKTHLEKVEKTFFV